MQKSSNTANGRNAAQEEEDTRGSASISNYRIVKTIGKGHYSK